MGSFQRRVAILDARIRPYKAHSRIDGSSSSTALPVIINYRYSEFSVNITHLA
jgi:hypothetical protein